MKLRSMQFSWLLAVVALLCGAAAHGQAPPPGPPPGFVLSGGPIEYSHFEMGLSGKTVTGAPYSAQIAIQRNQTLSDGTHISQQHSNAIYRDSAGRVRREMSLPAIGLLAGSAEAPSAVTIHDPVAGFHYLLHPDQKVAVRMPLPSAANAGGPGEKEDVFFGPGQRPLHGGAQVSKESLGTQTIEGVTAEGTRITKTIPAGAIGNDKAIQIVIERWYSPDLQVVVLTKRSDPWMGDSTMRLTNITRAEPAAALFSVPSDYTVTDKPAPHAFGRRVIGPAPEQE